ncbi:MAG TPA: hypothetical protein VM509_01360 [Planctomycetota bacterium]|nr:hypothetical protein [Planctomycetota bacterium]
MAAKNAPASARAEAAPTLTTAALRDAFSEVEWLDSDLDLGDGKKIDWIGVDASGRVVFALFCAGNDEASLIGAIDAMVFFARNRTVLAQHLQTPRVRAALEPVIALIAESFSEPFLERVAVLTMPTLRIFELRRLSSSRGERAYLVPLAPMVGRSAPSVRRGPEAFLSGLPDGCRPLGELLVKRIGRIDEQLVASSGDHTLSWRMGDDLMCSLAEIEGVLEGQIPPEGEPREIAGAPEVELFVDKVLERYVHLLGGSPADPAGEEPMFAAADAGLTLTPEEIAAFRQPE